MDLGTVALGIGATLCWSSTWVLMKAGVDRMDRTAFGFLRPVAGLAFIIPFAFATDGFEFGSLRLVWVGLAGGFINAFLGNALFYYALSRGSMHESNILAGISPLWGVVGAIVILGEPTRWATFVAALLVILGSYFLFRRGKNDPAERRRIGPILAALATGVCYGIASTVPAKICMTGGMDPITYQFLFTGTGAVGWTLVALPPWIRGRLTFSRRGVVLGLVSGVSGFFLGWVFWLRAIRRVDASTLAPLNSLTLLFAVLLGALFLRERITGRIAAGAALVIAGVTLVSVWAR